MGDQQYLVLDSPIPVDALQLGSLITDYRHPASEFFFEDHLKGFRKSWTRIDKNVEELMTVGSSHTEQSLLRRMLATSPANDLSEIYELQSLECRVCELINTSEWFEEVISLPRARSWAQVNLQGRHEVHLLTGFRTFRDGILRKRRNVKTSTSINIGVPASVAVPGIRGMTLGWSRSEGEESQSQYQTHEEVIFAVSYRRIRLKKFGQKGNAFLEHGRNWLRPWTKRRADFALSDRGRAAMEASTFVARKILANKSVGSVESIADYRDVPSYANVDEDLAENSASKYVVPTNSPRTRSPSPLPTQNIISAHDIGRTDNIQLPYTDMKSAIHELVIEADGSEEVLQLKEAGVSFNGDDHSEMLVAEDEWPETPDESSAVIDRNVDDVEDFFELSTRATLIRILYARALQIFIIFLSIWLLHLRSPISGLCVFAVFCIANHGMTTGRIGGGILSQFSLVNRVINRVGEVSALFTRGLQVVTKDTFGFSLALTFALGITPYLLFLLRRFPGTSVCTLAAVEIAHLEMMASRMGGRVQLYSPETSSSRSWQSTFSAIREDPQTYLRIPAPSFITSLVSQMRMVSRPRVRPGYRRIKWTCECGERLYGDFEVSVPGLVDLLEERLHFSRPYSNASNVASSESSISAPPQAHVNPPGAPSRDSRFRDTASTADTPTQLATSGHSPPPRRRTPKKYFELCINHGKWERRLGEIDVSAVITDGELFREIRGKYQAVRGFRTKKLYLLEPVDIHFVQVSLYLEERHRLNIHEEPDSWPSLEELERKTWEYSHPPKIPADTFLHYMNSKRPHAKALWLPTMPKKLERKMEEEESQLPVGWGIHIIEGLNKSLVSWLFWIVTTAVVVAGIAWSIWKQKGVAVAPLAMAILGFFVSFLTSEFYKQLET